jgi:hypothetical protein
VLSLSFLVAGRLGPSKSCVQPVCGSDYIGRTIVVTQVRSTLSAMAAFASVVGMVVSIKKTKAMSRMSSVSGGRFQAFGKMFFSFPDESECEASYDVNMLMLDG